MDDELEEKLKQLQNEREMLNAQLSESLEVLETVESDIEHLRKRQLERLHADERVNNDIVDKLASDEQL